MEFLKFTYKCGLSRFRLITTCCETTPLKKQRITSISNVNQAARGNPLHIRTQLISVVDYVIRYSQYLSSFLCYKLKIYRVFYEEWYIC